MIAKRYVLSGEFRYERTIVPDQGPVYAAAMGWPTLPFAELRSAPDGVLVIDQRLTPRECVSLQNWLTNRTDPRPILLKIVDPYPEYCRTHHYYQMLWSVANLPGVHFLSVYQPREWTEELRQHCTRSGMLWMPYPYVASDERTVPMSKRSRRVMLAGALEPRVYPLRTALVQRRRWNPLARLAVARLKHPGYPDIGQRLAHHFIGPAFLDQLSRYRGLVLDPARCGLEFLKYRECAYAGCVPVGVPPDSLSDALGAYFVPLRVSHLRRDVARLLTMNEAEVEIRAAGYRRILRQMRHPATLEAALERDLADLMG